MAKRLSSKKSKRNSQKIHHISLFSLICTFAVLFLMVYFAPKNKVPDNTESAKGFQVSMIGGC
ncbi:MAG: hypothetical protein LBE20_02255 [Deltaproteobacteria bacterium]|jgi:hypothetical protein|nr:hypothetical protein [Deltaproteobacteria bacterium]